MNLSINGQSQIPPGFRFHPTEEELLRYYLRKKVAYEKIDLDVIREVDLNKLEPWDIQEKCRIGSAPQNDWYFFSHKDKKYPTGTRTNRATAAGFWKATGRDKIIYSGFRRIGLRKTLVFYKGRAPHGQKSDWIMHEYRLDDNSITPNAGLDILTGDSMSGNEDGWVVCRVFKKKNYQKIIDSPKVGLSASVESENQALCSRNDRVLDQILLYMGRSDPTNARKSENQTSNRNTGQFGSCNNNVNDGENDVEDELLHERFMHLPRLETPNFEDTKTGHNDWVSLDRLVAWQLNNGQVEMDDHKVSTSRFTNMIEPTFEEDDTVQSYSIDWDMKNQAVSDVYGSKNIDIWSGLAESSSPPSSLDPLSQYLSI